MAVISELQTSVVINVKTLVENIVKVEDLRDAFEQKLRDGALTPGDLLVVVATMHTMATSDFPHGIDRRPITGIESFEVSARDENIILAVVILGEVDDSPLM